MAGLFGDRGLKKEFGDSGFGSRVLERFWLPEAALREYHSLLLHVAGLLLRNLN